MVQKMKNKSSGFQRGFLLNDTKRKQQGQDKTSEKHRQSKSEKASTILLEVESSPSKPSLLIVNNEPLEQQRSDEPFFGAITPQPVATSRPLIEDISAGEEKTTNVSLGATCESLSDLLVSPEDTLEEPFLMEEVSSSTRRSAAAAERNHGLVETTEDEKDNHDTLPADIMDGLLDPQAQAHISRLLTRVRHSRSLDVEKECETLLNMCGQSQSVWTKLWDSMLEDVATKQYPSLLGLATRLLYSSEMAIDALVTLLPTKPSSADKRDRMLGLGVAILTRETMQMFNQMNTDMPSRLWLNRVAPALATLSTENSNRERSVMSQTCMSAVYDIFTAVASMVVRHGNVNDSISRDMEDGLPFLESLLQLQETWVRNSIKDASSNPAQVGGASRKQCTIAVIVDWKTILSQTRRGYNVARFDKSKEYDTTRALCIQLAGTQLDGEEEMQGLGGLVQTLSHEAPKLTADNVILSLGTAESLLRASGSHPQAAKSDKQIHLVVRGVVAWLGQREKNLKSLLCTEFGKRPQSKDAIALSLSLLQIDSSDTAELVVTILNRIWVSSGGVPPDIMDRESYSETNLPPSFVSLLEQLCSPSEATKDDEAGMALSPSQLLLCNLVRRCIEAGGPSLLRALVARNGLNKSSVEIIAMLALETNHPADADGTERIPQLAGENLLDNLARCTFVQRKALLSPQLFLGLPLELAVPKLISDLAEASSTGGADDASTICSAASACLKELMMFHVETPDKFVQIIVDALVALNNRNAKGDGCTQQQTHNDNLVRHTCQIICGSWRRSLLQQNSSHYKLRDLAVSIGKAMLRSPSTSEPTTFFFSFLGGGSDIDKSADTTVHVFSMVMGLLEITTQKLVSSECPAMFKGKTNDFEQICADLSPLLLLRGIPATYFQVAWSYLDRRGDYVTSLAALADSLTCRLDIGAGQCSRKFYPEERRLSIEIAGRSLPFYEAQCCSSFHRICVPSFSALVEQLDVGAVTDEVIRVARAALYGVCHFLSIASRCDSGGIGLVEISWFVIYVLNKRSIHESSQSKGLDELYAGCIEFLGLCMEATIVRFPAGGDRPLVRELTTDARRPSTNDNVLTVAAALRRINAATTSFLQTGEPTGDWLQATKNAFGIKPSTNGLRVEATICMWNAVVTVSKKIPEGTLLQEWADRTAPWVLDWGASHVNKVDLKSATTHPGCIAAALQVVFILVTRTKSTACLTRGDTSSGVHRAHGWALVSIQQMSSSDRSYGVSIMRMAGLKLLLVLASIDSVNSNDASMTYLSQCLSPGEMRETLSVLQASANIDPDPEFRELAAHVIGALQLMTAL